MRKSMKFELPNHTSPTLLQARLDRRRFFRQAGLLGVGAAAAGLALPSMQAQSSTNTQAFFFYD